MRRPLLAAALALSSLALARPASAQELNGFGERRELILSVDRLTPLLSYSRASVTSTPGNATVTTADSGTSFALLFGTEPTLGSVHTIPRVAFDFVVVRHFTVGGSFAFAVGLSHDQKVTTVPNGGGTTTTRENDEPRATILGFAPRVGYVIPFGHVFGFWPRAGFAFYSLSTSSEQVNGQGTVTSTTTQTNTVFSLDLDPQFVWAPIEHVFVHFGPLVNVPLTGAQSVEVAQGNSTQTTSNDLAVFHVGLHAGLGGWFNL